MICSETAGQPQQAVTPELLRPIIGIENRTAQEAFDIMADRIRSHLTRLASASAPAGELAAYRSDVLWWLEIATGKGYDSITAALTAAPQPPVVGEHPDDAAVDAFAVKMKAKLARAREKGRGGWDDPEQRSPEKLSAMLHDHVAKGDPIDVANFAMMIDHYGASIAALATQPAEVDLISALEASLAKRSRPTMDPHWTAAFNAALDMVAKDTADARAALKEPRDDR